MRCFIKTNNQRWHRRQSLCKSKDIIFNPSSEIHSAMKRGYDQTRGSLTRASPLRSTNNWGATYSRKEQHVPRLWGREFQIGKQQQFSSAPRPASFVRKPRGLTLWWQAKYVLRARSMHVAMIVL